MDLSALLKGNGKWVVVLGAGVTLFAAALAGVAARDRGPVAPAIRVRQAPERMTQNEMRSRLDARTAQGIPTEEPTQNARASIAAHQVRIEEAPEAPEAPALFLAMGNLYRHDLGDTAQAIWCYQQILQRYPEWDGLAMVYTELATCYEEMGEHQNVLQVYHDMMKAFPDDTGLHEFAKDKLGL